MAGQSTESESQPTGSQIVQSQLPISSDNSNSKAHWNEEETSNFIKYLFEHKSEMGEGSFKKSSYAAAAIAIEDYLTIGPKKTGKMCGTKWRTFKTTYSAIQKYRGLSGVHWDNEKGANIVTPAEAEVWNRYVAVNSNHAIKPFRNKGWPYLSMFDSILGQNSGATGRNAFDITDISSLAPNDNDNDADMLSRVGAGDDTGATISAQSGEAIGVVSEPGNVESDESIVAGTTASTKPSDDPMEIDNENSTSANKRKHADDTTHLPVPSHPMDSSLSPPPPMSTTLVTSIPTEPPKKKRSTGAVSAKANGGSSKMSTAVAVTAIQGSLNHFSDVMVGVMSKPVKVISGIPGAHQDRAIMLLQERDHFLTVDEKTKVLQHFLENAAAANAYVVLEQDGLRENWLRGILKAELDS